ncbi:LysR family transcriptional regulator [Dactylosporangium sp. CA-052675]|uniref:LysR family transcriptional regulator n=1 Tax=Dactylosporangium sp. CA-052675 TaxID=3239927 RepID=UPI003D922B96
MPTPEQSVPSEKDLRLFLAIQETGSMVKAAKECGVSDARASQIMKKIVGRYGGEVFRREGGQYVLTELGARLHPQARRIVNAYRKMNPNLTVDAGMPRIACLPHHIVFVGRLESRLIDLDPVGQEKIEVMPLRQRHRADANFEEHAIEPLLDGVYSIITGPPPSPDFSAIDELQFDKLYSPRLEAMVHESYPGESISLVDLVRRRLLLPPTTLRSRVLLDRTIAQAGLDDLKTTGRIAGESYETLTHVLRVVVSDHHRPPDERRVVVVPSDVALKFKRAVQVGAWGPDRYKWLPIIHQGREITHDVYLTTTKGRSGMLYTAVKHLREVCEEMQSALSGNTVTLPAPRRAPERSLQPAASAAALRAIADRLDRGEVGAAETVLAEVAEAITAGRVAAPFDALHDIAARLDAAT